MAYIEPSRHAVTRVEWNITGYVILPLYPRPFLTISPSARYYLQQETMVVYGYGSKQLEASGERQGTLALSRWKNRKSQRVLTRTWWMKKIEVLLSVLTRYASCAYLSLVCILLAIYAVPRASA